MSVSAAKWTAGVPSVVVDPSGTLMASVPLKDGGALAATVTFTISAGRELIVKVVNEPGVAGLSGFQAWSS